MREPSGELARLILGLLEESKGRPLRSLLPAGHPRREAEALAEFVEQLCPELQVDLEISQGRWSVVFSLKPKSAASLTPVQEDIFHWLRRADG